MSVFVGKKIRSTNFFEVLSAMSPILPAAIPLQAFEKFRDAIGRVLLAQVEMAAADKVEMFVALMNFTGSVLPNIVENVNQVGDSLPAVD